MLRRAFLPAGVRNLQAKLMADKTYSNPQGTFEGEAGRWRGALLYGTGVPWASARRELGFS